jgi:hypothetical protein
MFIDKISTKFFALYLIAVELLSITIGILFLGSLLNVLMFGGQIVGRFTYDIIHDGTFHYDAYGNGGIYGFVPCALFTLLHLYLCAAYVLLTLFIYFTLYKVAENPTTTKAKRTCTIVVVAVPVFTCALVSTFCAIWGLVFILSTTSADSFRDFMFVAEPPLAFAAVFWTMVAYLFAKEHVLPFAKKQNVSQTVYNATKK